jgi:cleavage and polyadenylation specificity factor subunit 2
MSGGNVLLPVDSAGRVLELLLLLHTYFETTRLSPSYSLVFLSHESSRTVDFARQLIEWLSEACQRHFDIQRDSPFALRSLRCVHSLQELQSLPHPACILATSVTLETSFAQLIMENIASDPRSLILFTQRSPTHTPSGRLLQFVNQEGPKTLIYERRRMIPLEGNELKAHLEKQRQVAEQAVLQSQQHIDDDDDEDDDEDDLVLGGSSLPLITLDSDSQLSNFTAKHLSLNQGGSYMFPFSETKRITDLWGEQIDLTPFTSIAPTVGEGGFPLVTPSPHDIPGATSSPTSHPSFDSNASSKEAHKTLPMRPSPPVDKTPKKCIRESVTLSISCRIMFVDLEGKSDGRSLKNILAHVSPRSLILINGTDEDKNSLTTQCQSISGISTVHKPLNSQCVELSSEQMFRATLHPSLLSHARMVSLQHDYELAYIEAYVSTKLNANTSNRSHAGMPTLLPLSEAATTLYAQHKVADTNSTAAVIAALSGHSAVFVGDYRFADLKRVLNEAGISSEFYGGIIVAAGGAIHIRKVSSTSITIQGVLCEEYFRVRQLLYGRFTIV